MAYLIVFAVGFIVGGLALMADIQRTEGRHARGDESMKKIDKAVEIIRGWSDEELKDFLVYRLCPCGFKMKDCEVCDGYNAGSCVTGWNEEVEE